MIKKRMKALARWLVASSGGEVKVFVDTAAVMEKPIAEAAGLGWQGSTPTLSPGNSAHGCFLARSSPRLICRAIRPAPTIAALPACLDICPTSAFPAPYKLDARRCISYLTIENKGPIPHEFRKAMGNRIYGCDDCLAVCPWNKFAQAGREAKLGAREQLLAPDLAALSRLDDAAFRELFSNPVKRIGRDRFMRNVLIAIGNSGNNALALEAERLAGDESALVRGAAVWALSQLRARQEFTSRAERALHDEADNSVRQEWLRALDAAELDGGTL